MSSSTTYIRTRVLILVTLSTAVTLMLTGKQPSTVICFLLAAKRVTFVASNSSYLIPSSLIMLVPQQVTVAPVSPIEMATTSFIPALGMLGTLHSNFFSNLLYWALSTSITVLNRFNFLISLGTNSPAALSNLTLPRTFLLVTFPELLSMICSVAMMFARWANSACSPPAPRFL